MLLQLIEDVCSPIEFFRTMRISRCFLNSVFIERLDGNLGDLFIKAAAAAFNMM
jgi:hypothetical protein